MFFCYLDESGSPSLNDPTSHFVLLGLAIPAETWKSKDTQVTLVKGKYALQDAEIHTGWMARDFREQRTIPGFEGLDWSQRRKAVLGIRALNLARPRDNKQQASLLKDYKKTEQYIHLTREERKACLLELAELVRSWKDARIFCEARDKIHAPSSKLFDIAFEQIVTRFDRCLAHFDRNGLLVQDNNVTVADKLTDTMRRYHSEGTLWSQVSHIVETPMFVDSRLTSMVQIADLCAYATRRFFENNERDLFGPIYRAFDRYRGTLVGLRHFTGPSFRCKCTVCRAHGRRR